MTEQAQPMADDFDFIVANATQPQQPQQQQQQSQQPQQPQQQQPQQQSPIQQHFNQNSVNGVVPWAQNQVATQAANIDNVQQPAQPVQPAAPVAPADPAAPVAPVDPVPPVAPVQEEKPEFKLDDEINNLLEEFGVGKPKDLNKEWQPDNQKWADWEQKAVIDEDVDNKAIAKDNKISIILEKLTTDRDALKDNLWQASYDNQQYKIANEKLQNKVSELIEKNTALEYDENKIQVQDDIKDFVHFYSKRSSEKDTQTPDSPLTKRTLAEAIRAVEAITDLSLDGYVNQYFLKNNPQMPKIWTNHYNPWQMNLDPSNPKERTFAEKKADPKWNPMADAF